MKKKKILCIIVFLVVASGITIFFVLEKKPQYLPCPVLEEGDRLERGSHDDLKEDRLHLAGYLSRERTVHRHDTAIDADFISLVSACPCLEKIFPDACPAGIHMFQCHTEGFAELPDDIKGCVRILDIIVAELLPSELARMGHRIRHLLRRTVESGCLMRVLKIGRAHV